VKVVLSGDGGDEVFAGYSWYLRWMGRQRFARIPWALRRGVLAPIGRAWPAHAKGGRVKRLLEDLGHRPFEQYARQMELFSPAEKRVVLKPEWCPEADYDDYWNLRQHWRQDLDPITRLQYLDLKTYLPDDILTKVDRASMRVALEVRPPLLDHRLIEQVFRIPSKIRFKDGAAKYLLKQAVKPLLPATILTRPKKGFSSPLMQWLDLERPWVKARLAAGRIVNPTGLGEVSGHLWGPKMWALMILEEAACGF
jgi:asparagine synthase (glutamine-hydrolysing)